MAIEKAAIGMLMAIIMLSVMSGMVSAMTPTPPVPPEPQYICPVCGEKFWTEEELYEHFTSEHPTTPIDIIWE